MLTRLVLAALLLHLAVSPSECRQQRDKIMTPEDIAIMRRGLSSGNRLADLINKKTNFDTFVKEAETHMNPFVEGANLVFDFIGSLFPTTEELILEEIKRGFAEVNKRLDVVISELQEIKKLIKWADMKVKFDQIEYKIRLMDNNLKNVMRIPNHKAGDAKMNFVYTYRAEYGTAGFALFDAIANNDQIFSRNLLTAAIKYTEGHRGQTQQFSKSLFGLLMKAACVEIAFERFGKMDLNHREMWKGRLVKSKNAMVVADTQVKKEWSKYYRGNIEAVARQYARNKVHKDFATALYGLLTAKFSGRYWCVVAFNPTDKPYEQASVLPNHAVRALKRHNRSYFVISSDRSNRFDARVAYSKIPNTCHCRRCKWTKAFHVMKCTPTYGQARFTLGAGTGRGYVISVSGRIVKKNVALYRGRAPFGRFDTFYFG